MTTSDCVKSNCEENDVAGGNVLRFIRPVMQVFFEANPGDAYSGKVVVIDPTLVNESTQNEFEVRGRLNNIRRVLLTEVQVPAIHRVVIKRNKTNINDEVLCIRLGEVPIEVDERFPFESIESLPIVIDKRGPGVLMVNDLKFPPGVSIRDDQRTGISETVLCHLATDAHVDACAFLRKDTSLCHAKYQCLSNVYFDMSLASAGAASLVFATDGSMRADKFWSMVVNSGLLLRIESCWTEQPQMRLPRTLLHEKTANEQDDDADGSDFVGVEDDSHDPRMEVQQDEEEDEHVADPQEGETE